MLGLGLPPPEVAPSDSPTRPPLPPLPPPPLPPPPLIPSPDTVSFGLGDLDLVFILVAEFVLNGSLALGVPTGLKGGWRRSLGFAAHAERCCCCLRGVAVVVVLVLVVAVVVVFAPPVARGFLEKGVVGLRFLGSRFFAIVPVAPVEFRGLNNM